MSLFWRFAIPAILIIGGICLGFNEKLKSFRYTVFILAAVACGLIFPDAFTHWGSFQLRNKWLLLFIIQLVMFGMGTQMSLHDFKGLGSTGKGVAIGLLCHFSIMPGIGWLLTRIFHFDPEIAAGVILIGSCSSGLASNVMVYIARANLLLSVVVTAMATLAAPFLTPLLMRFLAGSLIKISIVSMMLEIVKIVLVPIGAALLHDYLKRATRAQARRVLYITIAFALFFAIALYAYFSTGEPMGWELSIFISGAWLFGYLYHQLTKLNSKLDGFMPIISMAGIIYFTTVTTAAGRDSLLQIGWLLFIASVLHNSAGYFFGFWLSRLMGLDLNSARTIAFEVGLQNGGMASGLAASMGKLGTVGLPAAVFSPWMNISGSLLANYWRHRSLKTEPVIT